MCVPVCTCLSAPVCLYLSVYLSVCVHQHLYQSGLFAPFKTCPTFQDIRQNIDTVSLSVFVCLCTCVCTCLSLHLSVSVPVFTHTCTSAASWPPSGPTPLPGHHPEHRLCESLSLCLSVYIPLCVPVCTCLSLHLSVPICIPVCLCSPIPVPSWTLPPSEATLPSRTSYRT